MAPGRRAGARRRDIARRRPAQAVPATRGEIGRMLAFEGTALGAVGVATGLVVGGIVSLILVYVVNRQSFHWTMDLYLPGWRLGALCAALIGAACLASVAGAQSALDVAVLRAVREDW